jgi:SAM-dependent methyltransferase
VPTTASSDQIRAEFDTIARLTPRRVRSGPYEKWLLRQLPATRGRVLEIGCGVGDLARRLGGAFDEVVGIDASQGMIDEAVRRTPPEASVRYECADLFEWLLRFPNSYDCIVTVATLHHVDLAAALREMSRALEPGGRLLVHDLLGRSGWRNVVVNGVAWCVALAREAIDFGRAKPWELRRAFWRHGRSERYLTLDEVRRAVGEQLPGAEVRAHLLWRYSIVWTKP